MPILPNNTLSSIVNLVNRANSDPLVQLPLPNAPFTLDSSGVAGFFGGESAVRAMGTAYLIPKRRWLGWYNAPGAYEVAKQYSGLAKSHLFNALFPGSDRDPARILMVDGQVGPEYTPLYSPTIKAPSSIGHLGSLIARKASQMPVTVLDSGTKRTIDARVTFVKLRRIPGELDELELFPSSSIIFTVITILISVGGCISCALVTDWFSFASIALGIIANGVACGVIGSRKLYLKFNPPAPSKAYTPGDVLLRTDTNIIVLVGFEGMVRPFTHGRFVLRFAEMPPFRPEQVQSSSDVYEVGADNAAAEKSGGHKGNSTPKAHLRLPTVFCSWILQKCLTVDVSVILLLLQFLAQLLLIPQGTLFGQLMFIGTLLPSWIYHSYLSTLGLDLQTQVLFHKLSIQKNSDIHQYQLNTWTQAVVFACLVFRSIHPPKSLSSITTKADEQTLDDVLAAEMAQDKAEDEETSLKDKKKTKLRALKKALDDKAKAEKNAADMINKAKKAKDKEILAEVEVKKAKVEMDEAEVRVERANANEKKAAEKELKEKGNVIKKKEDEVDKRAQETFRNVRAKEAAADEARLAASVAEEALKEVKAELLKKWEKDQKEARKKQEDDRLAQEKEKGDNALQALLNALLPGQTDVWRAFKESLLRKLSTNNSADWANMEGLGTFNFNTTHDRTASVEGGKSFRMVDVTDLGQLEMYQKDANHAFGAWRRKKVDEIAKELRY